MIVPVFYIESSWGTLVVDLSSGHWIRECSDLDAEGDQALGDIERFDIAEWEAYYGHTIQDNDRIDILTIGYWDYWNVYEPPVDDMRKNQ